MFQITRILTRTLLLLCLLVASARLGYAQTSLLLRGGSDISSSLINHILCDHDGVMWVSTDNGINRLDAAKNRMLFNEQGGGNSFNYGFEDKQGRHWFCGADNVYLLDKATEHLKVVESFTVGGEKLSVRTTKIIQRKDGTILACSSGHGVLKLEEKNGELRFQQINFITMQPKANPYYFVNNIMEDAKGNLWLTTEKGVFTVRNKKLIPVRCADESKDRHYSFLQLADDGNIWAGNNAGGVWRINPTTLQVADVPALRDVAVACIVTNHKTEVLVGTNNLGMWQIDARTLSTIQLNVTIDNITDNKFNVHSLEDDMYGNLWVGCYQKGVAVLPKIEDRFSYIGRNSAGNAIIGNSCVMSLGHDKAGRVWVAGDGDGLYAIQGGQSVHYSPSATMPNTIMSQYCDSKGRLWLGTWLQGLWVLEPSTGKANKVNLPIHDSTYSVFAIREDSRGRIWIGTLGEGLFCLNVETGAITTAPAVKSGLEYNDTKNVIPNNWINDFATGPGDMLYLATCDGIGAINMKTNDCLKTFHGKNRMFAGINVNTIHYTKDNRLWIGTNGGLYTLNLKTLETHHFKYEDGLLGNMVQSIIETADGQLWVSTNAGVAKIRLSDNRIINYSSGNGMYGNEFSRNAAIRMPDGRIWFGGTEGITYFNPKKVSRPGGKTRFYITGLYVNGDYVTTSTESDGTQIISDEIMRAGEINLAYSDNSFSLEFSTLNYMSNDAMTYEYRIDNGQWQTLPVGTNTVSFSNMDSGTYKITIRALQQGQYSDERVITVRIRAPWYATWWAYIFYALLVVLAIWLYINRTRQRHINEVNALKLRQQEEMSEAKMQYFMNISHEIRTPMTLIISPLQRLITTDPDADRQSAYHRMNRNAHRILQLVNQMLDVRKIDKGQMQLYYREVDMVPYVEKIVNGFRDLGDTKRMNISFSCSQPDLRAWIDPMNFEKVIVNLLSNAFKYTHENGTINVTMTSEADKTFSIRVEDNGSGLNEAELDHIFDRFYQQQNASNHSAHSLGKVENAIQGTGIGLNLTQSLVTMHHGTITCANNGDGKPGCHFIVTLPLGRAHLEDNEIDNTPAETPVEIETVAPVVPVADPAEQTTAKPKTRKRILVVEDDPEISRYLNEELSRDFLVTVCDNGRQALDLLVKNVNKYELVISDVMMPVMDGLEMLHNIRQNTDINSIPVILLTARITDQDNIEGLQHGADAYITKPYNIEVVRSTAHNLIQRQSQLKNIFSGNQNPEVEQKIKVLSPDEKLMQRIMKVINANLSNPDLGNDLITREVGISRVHLYRKLKELTNLSLRDYIRNIRLTEAARLLSEQKHSIAEVAMRTGFENVSYFTVVFKQKYGVPPSQYRGKNASEDTSEEVVKQEQ